MEMEKLDATVVKGLLAASGIEGTQDIAAFHILLGVILNYQGQMGIPDDKLRKFLTITADFMGILDGRS